MAHVDIGPNVIHLGIFLIFLGIGFGSVIMGHMMRNGYVFKLVGAIIFFILGVMMNAEYDVVYITITTDGSQHTDEVQYFIGDGTEGNVQQSWLGWLFIGLGLIWVAYFFMDVFGISMLR